ncbi:peptidylprolyl isomerase [bacterium]|nr:peptidylprolyl isomerase [bacterium]
MLEEMRKKQKIIIYAVAIVFVLGMAPLGLRSCFEKKPDAGKINGNDIDRMEFDISLQNSLGGIQQLLRSIENSESEITILNREKNDINSRIRRDKFELSKIEGDSLRIAEINSEIEDFEQQISNNDQQIEQLNKQIEQLKENLKQYSIDFNQYKQTGSLSDLEKLQLEDRIWSESIGREIINQELKAKRIKVSKDEYNTFVAKEYSFFYDESGTLNENVLNSYFQQTGLTPDQFKENVEYQIKIQKLQDLVTADSLTTMEEFETEYLKNNTKRSAKVLAFPSFRFKVDSTAVVDSDIENYYNENKDDYKLDGSAKLTLAHFEIKASEADEAMALEEIQSIYQEVIEKPQTFASVARRESDDPGSATRGGDLSWFGRGRMVAEFDSVAFGMEIGQISEPFKTQFGYHIIKLDDKKTEDDEEQVKARHILIKIDLSEQTKAAIRSNSQAFVETASADNFAELAKEYNAEIVESPWLATDGTEFNQNGQEAYHKVAFMANSYFNYGFRSFVRDSKPNNISPIFRDKEGNYVVVMVTEKKPENVKELNDDLKKSIRNTLETKKKIEYANKMLDKFNQDYQVSDYQHLITDSLLTQSTLDTVRVKIKFNEIPNTTLPKDEVNTDMLRSDYNAAKKSSLTGLRLVKAAGTYYLVTLSNENQEVVADIKMAVNEARNINKNSKYMAPISNSEKAIELLFEAPMNQLSEINKTDEGNFIIKVVSSSDPDLEAFSKTKDADYEAKIEREKETEFNKWYAEKLKDARVTDRRFMAIQ